MNYLFDINHPAQVHLLEGVIKQLEANKHKVLITSKNSSIINSLLEFYKLQPCYSLSSKQSSFSKVLGQILKLLKTIQIVVSNKIDVGIGTSYSIAQASKLTPMHSIILDDDDDDIEPKFIKYAHSYADCILSPSPIVRKSNNHISYNGYHELAYLHPKRFKPNINVVRKIGLKSGEPYFVLRFVAFKGHHDIGHKGISLIQKRELINCLKDFGKIFITSEVAIEPEFEQYRLPVPPEEIHSLLFYARLFLGDSQTMTTEAAILGTPSLKCNTFAGRLSVPNELEEKYGLCYSFQPTDFSQFFEKTKELLVQPDLDRIWQEKRKKFLSDKIDVTAFMVWFIENYPQSAQIMKENPDYQYNF